MTDFLIPKGYVKGEVSDDQYKKVTVTFYHNSKIKKSLILVQDAINETDQMIGPFDLRQIAVLHHAIGDVLWKNNLR